MLLKLELVCLLEKNDVHQLLISLLMKGGEQAIDNISLRVRLSFNIFKHILRKDSIELCSNYNIL